MNSSPFSLPVKTVLSLAISLSFFTPIHAADFTIIDGETETTTQTLIDNETGTIDRGGQLNATAADAINATGINNVVDNSGSISTTGNNVYGIFSSGTNATISNSGSLSTIGDSAEGIFSVSIDASISNSGSISTTGDSADGIVSHQADVTISNSGIISTTGGSSNGIFSTGLDAIIRNSGSISTTGNSADGIISVNADATISNSGSISTIGDDAEGIFSAGDDTAINNSGSISTTGDSADGIFSVGADTTINNSGLISATGSNSFAIIGVSNDITLNLLPGSQIIGAIDLGDAGGDVDTANVYAGSTSVNLTFLNTEVINLYGAGVVASNNVVTVDATAESSRSVVLAGLTSFIHNAVSQRMAHTTPLKPIQVASLELSSGMLFQERAPTAWAQVFGGNFDRDDEGSALGYETDYQGFTAGYEWDNNLRRVGLIGGVSKSDTDSDGNSFQIDVDSYFVGAYGHFNLGSVNLTASVLTGYGDHDNERRVVDNINGFEVAHSDVDSYFLSPSVTLSSAYTSTDKVELRPSATISYSVAWMDDYKETGTTNSNLDVDDRTLQVWTAKLQLAAAYQLNEASEFELRGGVNTRYSNDDNTHASVSGNGFSYSHVGDDSVINGFVGANIRIATADNFSFVADVEYGESSDESNLTGGLGLDYVF